ncbi:hypothetical protein [Nannocystis pusilla]|uniref:hypothetical protein n=1 Tax=Nannocystis pusilla TaxID=889268 RepID=UPI003B76AF27
MVVMALGAWSRLRTCCRRCRAAACWSSWRIRRGAVVAAVAMGGARGAGAAGLGGAGGVWLGHGCYAVEQWAPIDTPRLLVTCGRVRAIPGA